MNQVFDKKALLERCDGDIELIAELMTMFIDDYPRTLGELEAAVKSGDSHKIDRSAHAIKSALGNLGAMVAYQAAYDLEVCGKKGIVAEAPAKFTVLQDAVQDFLVVWNKEKDSLK